MTASRRPLKNCLRPYAKGRCFFWREPHASGENEVNRFRSSTLSGYATRAHPAMSAEFIDLGLPEKPRSNCLDRRISVWRPFETIRHEFTFCGGPKINQHQPKGARSLAVYWVERGLRLQKCRIPSYIRDLFFFTSFRTDAFQTISSFGTSKKLASSFEKVRTPGFFPASKFGDRIHPAPPRPLHPRPEPREKTPPSAA